MDMNSRKKTGPLYCYKGPAKAFIQLYTWNTPVLNSLISGL